MSDRALGLDIGLSKARTVLARLWRNGVTGRFVIEALETWQGHPGEKVDLIEVEDVAAAEARQHDAPIVLDPFQAVLMAQRLRVRGAHVIEYGFTGESRRKLFATLLDLIRRDRLRSRPHDALRQELLGLEVKETPAGWRADHRVGRHDDHVVATALAISHLAARRGCTVPGCRDDACSGLHMIVLGSGLWDTRAPVGMSRAQYDAIMAEPDETGADAEESETEAPAPVAATSAPPSERLSDLTEWNRARRERRDLEVW